MDDDDDSDDSVMSDESVDDGVAFEEVGERVKDAGIWQESVSIQIFNNP